MSCEHWSSEGVCGAEGARLYGTGLRCLAHTPARLAGRDEPSGQYPEPLPGAQQFRFRRNDSALIDSRARGSGKRATAEQRRGPRS